MLLEWETNWRRGLEARRKYVQPVAAYFTQVSPLLVLMHYEPSLTSRQIGGLHTVHHLWHYPNLDERKKTRDAAWQVEVRPLTAPHNPLAAADVRLLPRRGTTPSRRRSSSSTRCTRRS